MIIIKFLNSLGERRAANSATVSLEKEQEEMVLTSYMKQAEGTAQIQEVVSDNEISHRAFLKQAAMLERLMFYEAVPTCFMILSIQS